MAAFNYSISRVLRGNILNKTTAKIDFVINFEIIFDLRLKFPCARSESHGLMLIGEGEIESLWPYHSGEGFFLMQRKMHFSSGETHILICT